MLYLGTREHEQDSEKVGTMGATGPLWSAREDVEADIHQTLVPPSAPSVHELDCERGNANRCQVPGLGIVRSARRFSCSICGIREAANSKRLLPTDTEGGGHFPIDYDVVLTGVSKVCIAIDEDTGSLHVLLAFGTLLS